MTATRKPQILRQAQACVLGAGVTGLAAGLTLDRHEVGVAVVEAADAVGGLARTLTHGEFRFDLGGHRFFTKSALINRFVEDLMGDEMVEVERRSSIYYDGRYFDYPLRAANVLANLGLGTSGRVVLDYAWTRAKRALRPRPPLTVEDWMVDQFGQTLYNLFFRDYTAKVWGLPGDQLSQEWAGQRIRGFSLPKAIKYAFVRGAESRPKTLIERFTYPRMGIGRIAERMAEEVGRRNPIYLNARVRRIHHDGAVIKSAEFDQGEAAVQLHASQFVSSIPLTLMLGLLDPPPPAHVLAAAAEIRFRGLLVLHVIVDRERLTDQTWIYIQEPSSIVSRVHEPKNWSAAMAPARLSSLVVEIPASPGEALWEMSDDEVAGRAIDCLRDQLRFVRDGEVLGVRLIRLPRAYPVYHIGYDKALGVLLAYVKRFRNLQTVGRAGLHKYANIDHCLECGILAARNILGGTYDLNRVNSEQEYLEEIAS